MTAAELLVVLLVVLLALAVFLGLCAAVSFTGRRRRSGRRPGAAFGVDPAALAPPAAGDVPSRVHDHAQGHAHPHTDAGHSHGDSFSSHH